MNPRCCSSATLFKAALACVLLVCLAVFVVRTWHWPLVGDAAWIHYVVFLIDHGKAPYRDIVDVNMPGAYFVESAVMHLMGDGSLAWRVFDLLLGAAATLAMIFIAWPWDRFAGFLAGTLFILLHGRDGLIDLGERDLTMTVLLLIGYALLFHALRGDHPRSRLWATALFGFCLSFAITVKPTAVLLVLPLLVLLCLELRRRSQPWLPHLLAACAGLLLPGLVTLLYLQREHAVAALLTIIFRLIPAHADQRRRSFGYLLAHSFADSLSPLLLLWLPVALFGRIRRNWESVALLLGVLFGLASFYLQAKGYPYHRYPAEAFLLLLVSIDACMALSAGRLPRSRWVRPLAAVALAALIVVIGIGSTRKAIEFNWRDQEFNNMLRADLTQLGGPSLNGRVQCMEMFGGCINVLYHMRLMPATDFLFNCYALPEGGGYRARFWREISARPPAVFILSSLGDNGPRNRAYPQTQEWPQFTAWLSAHYFLYASRVPPHQVYWTGRPSPPPGYRIYVRDDLSSSVADASHYPRDHTFAEILLPHPA